VAPECCLAVDFKSELKLVGIQDKSQNFAQMFPNSSCAYRRLESASGSSLWADSAWLPVRVKETEAHFVAQRILCVGVVEETKT